MAKLTKKQTAILNAWVKEMLKINPVYIVTNRDIDRVKSGEIEKRLLERKVKI